MKKSIKILFVLFTGILTCSCSEFLQKPDTTGTVDLEAVYSSTKNAQSALMRCYMDVLRMGWPGGMGINHCTYGAISGEVGRGYNWHASYDICNSGLSVNGTDGSDAGADHYGNHWKFIRECFIVKENIDKVPDMSDQEKAYYKAEVTALIAYQYMGMFYRYGGVPIVEKSFEASDDLSARRASLEEVLDYICQLCKEAYDVLPAKWDAANDGRMTKGAVLCIEARAKQFAARPLFNSDAPYIPFEDTELNNLVSFGKADVSRWNDAITANEAVLSWASANGYAIINTGGAGVGQPNPNAFEDYATATSIPSNKEVILAFKNDGVGGGDAIVNFINCSAHQSSNRYDTDCSGVLTNFIENYYAADGSELTWPKVGEPAPHAGTEWVDNINNIEQRALADIKFGGFDSKNNPDDASWQCVGWGRGGWSSGKDKASVFPGTIDADKGCGERTKFFYKAGGTVWFEAPLFRMAEIYLNLAEAYNEAGNPTKALENLNIVHNRAGLPSITETDQAKLRQIIKREFYIELFQENGNRYYASKHWKDAKAICGGDMRMLQFSIKSDAVSPYYGADVDVYWDAVAYSSYWSDKMFLEPFPQSEVNKGTTTQNPGY